MLNMDISDSIDDFNSSNPESSSTSLTVVQSPSQVEGTPSCGAPTPVRKISKRKCESDANVEVALLKIEEAKLKILEGQSKPRDEDESFFDSLLPHVRSLTPEQKIILRIKIQELILSFIYKNRATPDHTQESRD